MTFFKEKTIELIENLPEDKMAYVFNIVQNLDAMTSDINEDEDAFAKLMTFHKSIQVEYNENDGANIYEKFRENKNFG